MKNKNLVLSGLCMALAGAVLLLSQTIGVKTSKVLVTSLFVVGGYFAYLYSRGLKDMKIGQQFYLAQAIGMMVFGALIALFPDSLESFLKFVTYFMLLFGFFEIGFGLMAFDMSDKVRRNIVIYRLASGFLTLIGAVVLLLTTSINPMTGLMIAGILLIISGTSFITFAQKVPDPKDLPA